MKKRGSDTIPYIKKESRKEIDIFLDGLIAWMPEISDKTVGDYTYIIYKLLLRSMGKKKFYKLALAKGCLDSVKDELHDRHVRNYENKKIKENGDIE